MSNCVADFCVAENKIKTIDREHKIKRTELYDCSKTLKELIKNEMINNDISTIEVAVGNEPYYFRINTASNKQKIELEDVIAAIKNISSVIKTDAFVPDKITETIMERLKEKINVADSKAKTLTFSKHKSKNESVRHINQTPYETNKLVSDFLNVDVELKKVKHEVKNAKQEFVNIKKQANDQVLDFLKSLN